MNNGKIYQLDTSREIYENPQSLFVARFIMKTNITNAIVTETTEKVTTLQIGKGNVYVTVNK